MSRESDEGDSKMELEVAKVQRERERGRKEETNLDSPRIQGKHDKTKPRAKKHKRVRP